MSQMQTTRDGALKIGLLAGFITVTISVMSGIALATLGADPSYLPKDAWAIIGYALVYVSIVLSALALSHIGVLHHGWYSLAAALLAGFISVSISFGLSIVTNSAMPIVAGFFSSIIGYYAAVKAVNRK